MTEFLRDALIALLVACVGTALIPVVGGIALYGIVPFHARRTHLRHAAPYLPRVVVLIPAWNEAAVLTPSLERLMALEYPPDRLRVLVIDDASTDDTPAVVAAVADRFPGRIVHLRREKGGQGKAHTLNHGIRHALADDWMQALLIMDADVVYRPDSLRRMTRHLADPRVGAVSGYIREGSVRPSAVTRFIGYEYVTGQAAARRAENVVGAMDCLAGGAQLHSRTNIEAIGGQVDTSTLAEDTMTTFLTQLDGRLVVFDPSAVVLAEEPDSVTGLWKQRLRWGRGNVQISSRFRDMWFRPARKHNLGSFVFGFMWFAIYLLPFFMTAASVGLIGLFLLDELLAAQMFQLLWWVAITAYVFITATSLMLDPLTARRSWFEALLFPGAGFLVIMAAVFVPGLWDEKLPAALGIEPTPAAVTAWVLLLYAWPVLSMVCAWGLKQLERVPAGTRLTRFLVYLVGYGPVLCAVSADAYIKEWQGAAQTWDKTEKKGTVAA
ncbi:glycosyltransferase [Cellulomonas fimi]|nr:glycosyltransferase [Cellulomonas fimi]NNH06346.1 glycosyltransferase family 2 protein [Cellulomonas fimi]